MKPLFLGGVIGLALLLAFVLRMAGGHGERFGEGEHLPVVSARPARTGHQNRGELRASSMIQGAEAIDALLAETDAEEDSDVRDTVVERLAQSVDDGDLRVVRHHGAVATRKK